MVKSKSPISRLGVNANNNHRRGRHQASNSNTKHHHNNATSLELN